MKKFVSKKTILPAIIILLVAGFITAYFVTERKVLYHFDTVDPGKMYRSGTLSNLGLKWAHKISGFKTIVNVRSLAENKLPWHKGEQEFCRSRGIKMIDIPMKADTPPTPEQVKQFLELVKNPENLPVIVHCHQGVTRTAMIVAVYEIAVQHKNNKDVLEHMNTFGHNFNKPDKRKTVDFILNFKAPDKNGKQG